MSVAGNSADDPATGPASNLKQEAVQRHCGCEAPLESRVVKQVGGLGLVMFCKPCALGGVVVGGGSL